MGSRIGFSALIPAAGAGRRLGLGPKAFLRLGDRMLLQYVVDAFRPYADEIIAAVPRDRLNQAEGLLPGVQVIIGGDTRQQTVEKLLLLASSDIVLVHDAARPLLGSDVIRRTVRAAAEQGAVTTAVPVSDSVFDVEHGTMLERERLWAIQTPQGFHRNLLLRAHRTASNSGRRSTDDADLVRDLGHPVTLVEGDSLLLKVTTLEDLIIVRAVVRNDNSIDE
jgi:2-C-methyl-D-erythritol 4-phosphate cytidylyltransferase